MNPKDWCYYQMVGHWMESLYANVWSQRKNCRNLWEMYLYQRSNLLKCQFYHNNALANKTKNKTFLDDKHLIVISTPRLSPTSPSIIFSFINYLPYTHYHYYSSIICSTCPNQLCATLWLFKKTYKNIFFKLSLWFQKWTNK